MPKTESLVLVPPSRTEAGFLDDRVYDSTALGPGYDRPFQFDPSIREPKTIQLYKHLNLKSCVWTFDAYYDMTELIDVCGGSVTADFQVGDPGAYWKVRAPECASVSTLHPAAPRTGIAKGVFFRSPLAAWWLKGAPQSPLNQLIGKLMWKMLK